MMVMNWFSLIQIDSAKIGASALRLHMPFELLIFSISLQFDLNLNVLALSATVIVFRMQIRKFNFHHLTRSIAVGVGCCCYFSRLFSFEIDCCICLQWSWVSLHFFSFRLIWFCCTVTDLWDKAALLPQQTRPMSRKPNDDNR